VLRAPARGLHWMDPISGRDFFRVEKVIQ